MNWKDLSLEFLLKTLLPAVIVLIVGAILVSAVLKVERKLLDRQSSKVDPMLHGVILKATKIVLWILVLLEVCRKLGVDATSFLTVFAACGAAVALGLKDSLSNLASGILIMCTRPFVRGDYIICAGSEGVVDSIDLLHTTILTIDNKTVNIPNSQLTSNTITNATRQATRRVDLTIGVSYHSNLDAAKKALLDLSARSGLFLDTPAAVCNVLDYADSAVMLNFRGWCNTSDYWDAFFYMNNGMKDALESAGAEIPFPQLDIHQI